MVPHKSTVYRTTKRSSVTHGVNKKTPTTSTQLIGETCIGWAGKD